MIRYSLGFAEYGLGLALDHNKLEGFCFQDRYGLGLISMVLVTIFELKL